MNDEDAGFEIDLAKIGMRYGARITIALAVFAIGGGLLFTTSNILFSEHPNVDLAYITVISSFALICSGIAIVWWSTSQSRKEIDKLRNKSQPSSCDNSDKMIQEKLEFLKTLKMSDPGLLTASDLHNIVKAQMDLTTSLSNQQHRDIIKIETSSNTLKNLTVGLLVLTVVLIFLTGYSLMESRHSSELLSKVTNTNNLMLANLYSNYALELKYDVFSFDKQPNAGGIPYDLKIINYGDYDAQINSTWYLNDDVCDNYGNHTYPDITKLIANGVKKTDIITSKNDIRYTLEIPRINQNYTNLKPFTLEIVSKGTPITADKKPLGYFTKSEITRIQFIYDEKLKTWMPQLGWNSLDCNSVPSEERGMIEVDTKNNTEFRPI